MKKGKIFWGLFFLLAGTLVILNQLNIFAGINIITLLLTIFLTAILIKSISHVSFVGILFSLAFILILYADRLNLGALSPWPILCAALLGSIGLNILFAGKNKFICKTYHVNGAEREDIDADSIVDVSVSFGACSKYINSKNLEKINISCHFGAAEVYLNDVELKDDSAIINLDVSFAGVEIYIPREYAVENKADVALGTVEEKNRNNNEKAKKIIITGKANLSGVDIIYI